MLKRKEARRQEQFYYQNELALEIRYHKEKPPTCAGSVSSYIKEFCRETTVHGIGHVFAPDRHPVERCFWLIVTFVAMVYAASFITTNMQRFETNPTMIVLEKNFRDWNVTMPAFTFCVLNRMNETRANETILTKWGQVDEDKMQYYKRFLYAVVNISYDQLDKFKEFENDDELNTITSEMEELAFSVHVDFQLEIFPLTYEAIGGFVLTEMGLCYAVGSVVSRYIAPRKFNITPEMIAFEEPANCTSVHSDCKMSLYSVGVDVKLYVHSPYEIIEANTRSVVMTRWFHHQFTFTYDELKSEIAVKNLRRSQRRCYLYPEIDFKSIPFNSYAVCLAMCRQRLAKRLCGCVPYFYRPLGRKDLPVCNAKGLVCLHQYKDNLERIIGTNGEKIDCKCSHPCDIITYICLDHKKSNMQKPSIKLYLTWNIMKFPRSRYKRDVIYSIEDLLVSHGGTAGFFLGCSLLSVTELVYFFTLRLVCLLIKTSGNVKKNYQQRRSRRPRAFPAATNSNEIFHIRSSYAY